jgi:hypothetical protein
MKRTANGRPFVYWPDGPGGRERAGPQAQRWKWAGWKPGYDGGRPWRDAGGGTMPEYHPACQEIAQAIAQLQQEAALLAEDLKAAAPGQKPAIAAQIRKINSQIAVQQKALDACVKQHPLPAPVVSTLTGRAGIWRRPGNAAGYFSPITLGMTFSGWNMERVTLAFPTLVFPSVLRFTRWGFSYSADISVSMTSDGRGSHDPVSHNLSIPLAVKVTPTGLTGFLSSLVSVDPSTMTLFQPGLTTRTLPSTLDPKERVIGSPPVTTPGATVGQIRLAGEGRTSGGYCQGWGFYIEISGVLAPIP